MELENIVDKSAITVIKKGGIVEHLVSSKSGKLYFFYLRADLINSAEVKITGKPINNGKGMDPI